MLREHSQILQVPSTPGRCQLSVHKHSFSTPVHPVVVRVASYMRSLSASRGDTEMQRKNKKLRKEIKGHRRRRRRQKKKLQQAKKAERRNTRERTAEGMEYDIMQRQKRTMKRKKGTTATTRSARQREAKRERFKAAWTLSSDVQL